MCGRGAGGRACGGGDARLAFYDMTAVLEVKDGKITLRDPMSLPEDLRRAIVGE